MSPDWLHQVFGRDGELISWWQMSARAAFFFVWGLLLVRLGGQRMFGKITAFDIVVAVILGSILSRAITGNAAFLPSIAATTTLVLLHWLTTRVAWRWGAFGRVVKGRPVRLVEDGRPDETRMRATGITEHDLEEAMRRKGVESLEQVKAAYLERDGEITVISK